MKMDAVLSTGACAYAIICTIARISGLPEIDILAGTLGAFISLAFTKPEHWSDWINYKPNANVRVELLLWIRRVILVSFILFSVVIIAVAFAQFIHTAPEFSRWHSIDTRLSSLLLSAGGQTIVPKIIKRFSSKGPAQ